MNKPFSLFAEKNKIKHFVGAFSSEEEIKEKYNLDLFEWHEIIDTRDFMTLDEVQNLEKIVSKIIMPNNLDAAIRKLIVMAKLSHLRELE